MYSIIFHYYLTMRVVDTSAYASIFLQELLNHLNNVLASIPSNAPPTPITPNNLHDLVQQQQQQQRQHEQEQQQQHEQQQEDDAKFNQSRAEFFRYSISPDKPSYLAQCFCTDKARAANDSFSRYDCNDCTHSISIA